MCQRRAQFFKEQVSIPLKFSKLRNENSDTVVQLSPLVGWFFSWFVQYVSLSEGMDKLLQIIGEEMAYVVFAGDERMGWEGKEENKGW